MAFGAQDKGDLGLRANVRPGSVDPIAGQRLVFPLEAFEFTDPNRVDNPELKMKPPWRLVADYISSSGDAWNYDGVVGIVPEDAYYSGMRAPSDGGLALLNLKKDDLVAADSPVTAFAVTTQRATIAGSVDYDLTQMTTVAGAPWQLSDGYTIIVKSEEAGWEYLSSEGPTEGNMISLVGTTLNIESSNLLPQLLPFLLLGNSEWFQDLMVIPYGYSQSQLDSLLDGIDNFSPIEGNLSADRGYILSPDGFYWYNGGQYIQLGTEALFSAVDLKSGDWDGSIEDGEIISTGTKGWAIAHKGDVEFNDGTFRGTVVIGSGEDLDDALDSKITTYRQTGAPSGTLVTGDLWYDTDDNNKLYRYLVGTGWEATVDGTIADAQSDATQAIGDASTAQAAAVAAQGTADGKNTIYVSLADPSLTYTMKAGDIWYDQNADTDIPAAKVGQKIWTGSAWTNSYSIKSAGFNSGSDGWAIWDNGDVEFNNGTFRGDLDAAGGSFTGSLSGADGSFSGDLSGSDITGTTGRFDALIGHEEKYRQITSPPASYTVDLDFSSFFNDTPGENKSGIFIANAEVEHSTNGVQNPWTWGIINSGTLLYAALVSTTNVTMTIPSASVIRFSMNAGGGSWNSRGSVPFVSYGEFAGTATITHILTT